MEARKIDAIIALHHDTVVKMVGEDLTTLEWLDGNPKNITTKQIEDKYAELVAVEEELNSPIGRLRQKRDQLLAATDWRDLPSYAGTKQAKWRTYRQALRDLPSGLDTEEKVKNVTWPTKP